MSRPKIFCIGFHKTASTSLSAALEILTGQRVCGPVGILRPDIARTHRSLAFEVLDDYEIFKDNPFSILFKELDARCPGSRFILSCRDSKGWLASVVRHFGGQTTPMRELIYGPGKGDPIGNEACYLDRYERHNSEVKAYFSGRDDLLVMDIVAGDGWDPLCAFLGKPNPGVPFPVLNVAGSREAGAPAYTTHRLPHGKGRSSPTDP